MLAYPSSHTYIYTWAFCTIFTFLHWCLTLCVQASYHTNKRRLPISEIEHSVHDNAIPVRLSLNIFIGATVLPDHFTNGH